MSADAARIIASALRLERPLIVIDVESTGTNPEHDRIVEIAVTRIDPDGEVLDWATLVNPGIPIPASSTAIHHIADADVAEMPYFNAIAKSLAARFEECDLAGFNLRRFDMKILKTEFNRCGVAWDPTKSKVIDAFRIFTLKEPRDLAAARKFYGTPEGGETHRASADVQATLQVLAAQLVRYEDLPRGLAELDAFCVNRDPSWLDDEGKIIWRDGAARINFGQHSGKTMLETPRGYWSWMLGKDFSASTKAIAAAAIKGEFPKEPETTVATEAVDAE